MGYVAQQPFIFDTTIRENIRMGIPNPVSPSPAPAPPTVTASHDMMGEKTAPSCDLNLLRGEDPRPQNSVMPACDPNHLREVLTHVGLMDDLLKIALENRLPTSFDPHEALFLSHTLGNSALKEQIVTLRTELRSRLPEALKHRIERFEVDRFLAHTSIYGNLVFSDALPGNLAPDTICNNPKFSQFLTDHGLDEPLMALGHRIIQQSIVVLKNLVDDPYFFKATPIPTEEMPRFEALIQKYPTFRPGGIHEKDRPFFLLPALTFIPAEHKIAVISTHLKGEIVQFRKAFLKAFIGIDFDQCEEVPTDFPIYCPKIYTPTRTVMENLLFGSVQTAYASAWPQIKAEVATLLLDHPTVHSALIDVALSHRTGSHGSNLSGGQKQKIAIARALVKSPPLLVLDEATASLDNQSQQRIQSYITKKLKGRTTVISVIHRLDLLPSYDRILVLKDGKIVEQGQYDELMAKKGALHELVHGR